MTVGAAELQTTQLERNEAIAYFNDMNEAVEVEAGSANYSICTAQCTIKKN